MNKRIRIIALFLCVLCLTGSVAVAGTSAPAAIATEQIDDADLTPYWNRIEPKKAVFSSDYANMSILSGGEETAYAENTAIQVGQTLKVALSAPQGTYRVAVKYRVAGERMLDNLVVVDVDENTFTTTLQQLFKNEVGEIPVDRYGNQMNPEQIRFTPFVYQYLTDRSRLSAKEKTIEVKENTIIAFTPQTQATVIDAVYLFSVSELPDYATYIKTHKKTDTAGGLITVEAEQPRLKSSSFIRAKSVKNASMTPYSTYKKVLNVLDENSQQKTGQKVLYEFEVPKDGLYNLSFKYTRQASGNMACYRKIMIDGEVPFKELESVTFPYYSSGGYRNLQLSDSGGDPLYVYLSKGFHTISIEVDGRAYQSVYDEIKSIMSDINDLAMSLKKLVGNNTDRNRTWDVEDYLPDVKKQLSSLADRTDGVYKSLANLVGGDPTFANNLKYAALNIRKLKEDVRTLPNKLEILSEGSGSVAQSFGDLLPVLENQPVGFDKFYFSGEGETLPAAKPNFFTQIVESVKGFIGSFNSQMNSGNYSVSEKGNKNALNVWVNRPVQYVEIMQQMADADFTAKGGMRVNYSIMPNEQKLILSYASRTNPDVALGISYVTPFDFAIRGAAKNLLEYDDFLEWYNSEFNLEALTPMCFDHGVYGISETQDFLVLFYRKDILEKLGLIVPETWEDVQGMMPVLLRNGMNFNIPASNMVTFKSFGGIAPFIFQKDGDFYTATGNESSIRSDEFYDGMKDVTDLYRINSFSSYVASFYNSFRYGQVPIGVSGFSSYLQLELAAPELAGKWDIAPAPGTRDENGTIQRYQMADGTAGMIFENTKHSVVAYDFLKWWMSKDAQVDFAYTLQSTFGPEFRFNTANVEAFKELPYPSAHSDVIIRQWEWQKEVTRHPAGYMVEREVSNVWNNVVIMNRELRPELDNASLTSNREIIRKLNEFGYVDQQGNIIKNYPTDNLAYLRQLLNEQ